jgi:hypothetical protein
VKKYSGDEIKVFSKERLLIELVRNKNKLPFDYYTEIIFSYCRLVHQLDFMLIDKYAEKLPRTKTVVKTIQMEVL